MRGATVAVALLVPLLLAGAVAQGGGDRERQVSILTYDVGAPGPRPDVAPDRLPSLVVDRRADAAETASPDDPVPLFQETQRLVRLRQATGAPFELRLVGEIAGGALDARAEAVGRPPATLRVVLAEDDALVNGRNVRFLARAAVLEARTDAGPARASVPLDPAWRADRLALVAFVVQDGEVVQAATWRVDRPRETHQEARGVLLEAVTSPACDPCRPSETAVHLLASQYALPSLDAAEGGHARWPSAAGWLGLVGGAWIGIAFAFRRRAP